MHRRASAVRTPALVDSLVQLSFAIQEVLIRAAAEHGLSISQLRLLGIVRDGEPPMTAIADLLGLDRSSVTGLVDRAERRGLVSRSSSNRDARVTTVSVTAAGLEIGAHLAKRITTEIEALVAHVNEADRARLTSAAAAVIETAAEARLLAPSSDRPPTRL